VTITKKREQLTYNPISWYIRMNVPRIVKNRKCHLQILCGLTNAHTDKRKDDKTVLAAGGASRHQRTCLAYHIATNNSGRLTVTSQAPAVRT